MRIDNNLNGMLAAQMQVNESAQNIATVANVTGDSENMEATADIIDSLVNYIPQVIAYEANAEGIKTQQAVADTLLDLKA
ncbi:hypothetical protein CP965_02140 [Halarcobacter mediterraneus]|uniref:Uncharacterized protein n=1 Tax=Halarcobacter mediterraneus TaxID=2023153 RepID=A0A4Q1B1N9_9BACT|nr:hypothetical protein [Halarcobacter mediterraneus]RXK14271.1 hypothetical protein CP965_02140 [Halarcobacter mediterraneus]